MIREGRFGAAAQFFLETARSRPDLSVRAWRETATIDPGMEIADRVRRYARKADPSAEFLIESELHVPMMAASQTDPGRWRRRLEAGLTTLEAMDLVITHPERMGYTHMFGYFHVEHDKGILPIKIRYAELLSRACPELNHVSHAVEARLRRTRIGRLRLGVVVANCHTAMFSSMHSQFLGQFDRSRFEVVLFRPVYDRHDQLREFLDPVDAAADRVAPYPRDDFRGLFRTIEGAEVDILVHENWKPPLNLVGMARLAPVQCSFFDSVQSMGTPNEDYVLLCGKPEWLEVWRSWYREKIALLPDWPYRPEIGAQPFTPVGRKDLGLPEECPVLFTWQPVYRWRLGDDAICTRLLARNPGLHLVVISNPANAGDFFRERLLGSRRDIADRVHFIVHQPFDRLLGIIETADVLLAPPGTTGALSVATAIAAGKPYAVLANETFSQYVDGMWLYETIGATGMVARNVDEYVGMVQRFLDDAEWRGARIGEFREGVRLRPSTISPMRELEGFLHSSFRRARQGLGPGHWFDGEFLD